MKNISSFLITLFIFIGLFSCKRGDVNENQPYNVLFIAVDDLRLQTDFYGEHQMKTPNLNKLSKEGVSFQNAYCNVPVCGASRASLLSGLRPSSERFVNYYTRKDTDAPDVSSLPMWFKENGYTTLSRGKIYHHSDDDLGAWSEEPYLPAAGIGWQSYLTQESEEIVESNRTEDHPNRVLGPAYEAADVEDSAYPDGMLSEQILKDLARFSESGEQFFLSVGFWKPHLPFNAPKKYWDLYEEDELVIADNPYMPENAPNQASHEWNELRGMYTGIPASGPVSDELARNLIHGYYACVSYTDAQIGIILNELERLGLDENTVVVLWGDHGWHLGEHGLWCKHCNFDKVLNAPLMFRGPGVKRGVKADALTEFIDIYPTLCELTGIELPEHLDGKSLAPVLNNPRKEHKEAVFSRYHDGESVITKDFIYTQWAPEGDVEAIMLYDHRTDPDENVNIVYDQKYKETVDYLSNLLNDQNRLLEGNSEKQKSANYSIVQNGDFSKDLSPYWRISKTNGADFDAYIENGEFVCKVKSLGTDYWNAGLIQNESFIDLKANQVCKISLHGRANQDCSLKVQLQEKGQKLVACDIRMNKANKCYDIPLEIKEDGRYTLKLYFLDKDAHYYLDDIKIEIL
jgi:arylsulfatase A-like enzyme